MAGQVRVERSYQPDRERQVLALLLVLGDVIPGRPQPAKAPGPRSPLDL